MPPNPSDFKPHIPQDIHQVRQNLDAVHGFYARDEQKISPWQRLLEHCSQHMGHPSFIACILLGTVLWTLLNLTLTQLGLDPLDDPPFAYLGNAFGFFALLTATVVLTRQNRLAKLEEQRAHLDLKVTLLIEQKVAKLIELIEELRRDLPNVIDRHDPLAAALTESMGPVHVLAALDEAISLSSGSAHGPPIPHH